LTDLPFPFPPREEPTAAAADAVDAREQEALDAIADTPEEPLVVRVVERQGLPVLYVEGEVDIYTAGILESRLREIVAGRPSGLVIDLSRTRYLDSKGLGVLLQAARALPGRVVIGGARERIARLFHATGLARAIPLHTTLAEALASLAG